MANSTFRNYLMIFASIVLGTGAANLFKVDKHKVHVEKQESAIEESSAGQFIQEPSQRSSFRPDFSRDNGLNFSNKRSNFLVLRAFQDAIGGSWKSAAQISVDGMQVALGAVVGADGWIITKASQLASGKISCRLYDNREYAADLIDEVPEFDLALLRISAQNLPVVVWDKSLPSRGSWLATVDLKSTPRSVGVVSTGVQRVRSSDPVLGVHLVDSSMGASVTHVLPGTGADDAGLRIGDSIYQVNGVEVFTLRAFRGVIADAKGGELVQLGINRADKKFSVDARLMDLSDELLDDTEMEVNGRVSARATGFDKVFLHDTVLEPQQCGGPLVNLDGRVVGLNIARAGRVTSYALPADVVQPVIDRLIEQAKLVSRSSSPQSVLPPIR